MRSVMGESGWSTGGVFLVCSLLACTRPAHNGAGEAGTSQPEGALGSGAALTSAEGVSSAAALASAEPKQKHAAVRCSTGEVAVFLQPDEETCVVECKAGSDCPPGWACEGEGLVSHNGKSGAAVHYCRIEGHPKATDAGHVPSAVASVRDGGPNLTPPPEHHDAGPGVKRLDVKPVGGQCPAGYRACGAICRLACAKDTDCELATARCQGGFCVGPGAQPCSK